MVYHPEPHEVQRQSWKGFALGQTPKITISALMAGLFLVLHYLSIGIRDPTQVSSDEQILGIVLSSVLFLLVFVSFAKFIYLDHPQAFKITTWRDWRVFWNVILTFLFITGIYILLDSAFPDNNVFLLSGPLTIDSMIDSLFGLRVPGLTGGGMEFYIGGRNTIFSFAYLILFFFPLALFFVILTRLGRKKVSKWEIEDIGEQTSVIRKATLFLGIPPISLILLTFLLDENSPRIAKIAILIFYAVAMPWWLFHLSKAAYFGIRITVYVTYANLLWILPLVGFFFFLPVILWSGWDFYLALLSWNQPLEEIFPAAFDILLKNSFNITSLSLSLSENKVLQAVFILVISVATAIIGFAEGYTILAIYRALRTGWSFTRTGILAERSPPVIAVITSRIMILAGWLSFSIGAFRSLWYFIREAIPDLPDFPIPNILGLIIDLIRGIHLNIDFLLPLTLLLVP